MVIDKRIVNPKIKVYCVCIFKPVWLSLFYRRQKNTLGHLTFNKCLNVVLDSTDFHYIGKNILQKIGHWYYSDNISDYRVMLCTDLNKIRLSVVFTETETFVVWMWALWFHVMGACGWEKKKKNQDLCDN